MTQIWGWEHVTLYITAFIVYRGFLLPGNKPITALWLPDSSDKCLSAFSHKHQPGAAHATPISDPAPQLGTTDHPVYLSSTIFLGVPSVLRVYTTLVRIQTRALMYRSSFLLHHRTLPLFLFLRRCFSKCSFLLLIILLLRNP